MIYLGKKALSPALVIDTREQRPYRFAGAVRATLPSGDYSLAGLETRVAVERKRIDELFVCVGKERERFERELVRLAEYDYAAIVIEGRFSAALEPSPFSRVSPKAVVNSIVSWSVRFGVHIFFADSRPLARALTYRILEKFWKHRGSENAGQGKQVEGIQAGGPRKGR